MENSYEIGNDNFFDDTGNELFFLHCVLADEAKRC
jgi:hypothetical protein